MGVVHLCLLYNCCPRSRHSYLICSFCQIQTDVVTSRTAMVVRKVRGKAPETQTLAPEPPVNVLEPAKDSVEWSNMQMYKDIPRKVFTEVSVTNTISYLKGRKYSQVLIKGHDQNPLDSWILT